MTDKELAEKVAGYLGATKVSKKTVEEYSSMGLLDRDKEHNKYYDFEFTELAFHLCDELELEDVIFSWPVSGMMIDKIQSVHKGIRKWEIFWRDNGVSFCLPTQEWSADPDDPEWEKETKFYSCIDSGNHKAIAMAFCEAMEMIND